MASATDMPPMVTIVDDEPYARDILTRAAKSWQFDCQSAATAEQALELLERNLTPVVVTDLRMPGRGGAWLTSEIQRRWPEVSIIVVSAGEDLDSLAQCLDAGAHHYFLKPINFDEFHHALDSTLRRHRLQREREQLQRSLAKQTRKLRRTYLSAIDSLVRTLEARDETTSGHSRRVKCYVAALGKRLRLNARFRRQLVLAARLHDIGKVGLPEGILNKPAKLTDDEFAMVRKHPVTGERILSPIIRNKTVLAAIRGHHERYDGGGYPDGLRGDTIPLAARIITIADCFDAMTSARAYRPAMAREEAIGLMTNGAGTHFDPQLVAEFLDMI